MHLSNLVFWHWICLLGRYKSICKSSDTFCKKKKTKKNRSNLQYGSKTSNSSLFPHPVLEIADRHNQNIYGNHVKTQNPPFITNLRNIYWEKVGIYWEETYLASGPGLVGRFLSEGFISFVVIGFKRCLSKGFF